MFLQQDSSTLSYQSSFHQPRDDHITESSTEDCRIFHHYLLRISAFPVRLSISRFQETYEDTISWRSKAQAVPDSDSMSDMFFEHCGPPSPNPTKKICRGYDRFPPPFSILHPASASWALYSNRFCGISGQDRQRIIDHFGQRGFRFSFCCQLT